MNHEISTMSIPDIARALRRQEFTCEDLAGYFLDRISRLNGSLNAFIYVAGDDALAQARVLDQELKSGHDRGLLHGIPISIKDNFHVRGMRTTAGSAYLAETEKQAVDSEVAKNLRAAGANILGKNNMAEFAVGFTSRNEAFGDITNPWNTRYTAGGSSGGTAAAVAAGLCVAGIGSDTGGSVRLPASICGIAGIRPTRGLIELTGGIKRAKSLDIAGPLAKNSGDASILLRAMYGVFMPYMDEQHTPENDNSDVVQIDQEDGSELNGKVVALIRSFSLNGVDDDIERRIIETINVLRMKGATVKEVPLSVFDYIFESGMVSSLLLYEFYSHMCELAGDHPETIKVGQSVRNDLIKGASIAPEEYSRFLIERDQFIRNLNTLFQGVDAVIMPVMPVRTPHIDAKNETFELARKFLIPASYFGWPSISVPCGQDKNGLPTGIQIIGGYYQEQTILDLARSIEESRANFSPGEYSAYH